VDRLPPINLSPITAIGNRWYDAQEMFSAVTAFTTWFLRLRPESRVCTPAAKDEDSMSRADDDDAGLAGVGGVAPFNYRALCISVATIVLAVVLRRLVKRFGLPQLDLLTTLVLAALIAYLAG